MQIGPMQCGIEQLRTPVVLIAFSEIPGGHAIAFGLWKPRIPRRRAKVPWPAIACRINVLVYRTRNSVLSPSLSTLNARRPATVERSRAVRRCNSRPTPLYAPSYHISRMATTPVTRAAPNAPWAIIIRVPFPARQYFAYSPSSMRRARTPSPVVHEPSPCNSIVGGAIRRSFEKYVTQNAAFGNGTSMVSPRARLTFIAIRRSLCGLSTNDLTS